MDGDIMSVLTSSISIAAAITAGADLRINAAGSRIVRACGKRPYLVHLVTVTLRFRVPSACWYCRWLCFVVEQRKF